MYLVIVQSRNGSSRLPNKSSLAIAGNPTLVHVVNRIKKITSQSCKYIVATSKNIADEPISNICKINNFPYFRGDELNVFSRFKEIIKIYSPDYVIRITGDCPLIFSNLIDDLILITKKDRTIDYASNTIKRTFPHGMDVEIFKSEIILNNKSPTSLDKEHVTPFIYNSERFKIYSYENDSNYSNYRITLDNHIDYIFIDSLITKYLKSSSKNNVFDLISPVELARILEKNKKLSNLHKKAKEFSKFKY